MKIEMLNASADLQFKTLKKSKGRAVWSSRAQVDKKVYSSYVRSAILTNSNISCIEDTVVDIAVALSRPLLLVGF